MRILSFVAIGGIVYSIGSTVLLHLLRSDYDPATRFLSELAVGPYGAFMAAAFTALGLGSLALAAGLANVGGAARRSPAGVLLLGVWSLCIILVGIFPTDLQGRPSTKTGTIHNQAALLGFASVVAAMFVLAIGLRRDRRWGMWTPATLVLGTIALAQFVVLFAVGSRTPGWTQRAFFAAVLSWLLLTARRLSLLAG